MKQVQAELDLKGIVSRVRLPYAVPVDFIVRGFLLASTAIVAWVIYAFAIEGFKATPAGWAAVLAITGALVYLQWRPSGLLILEDGIEIRRYLFSFNRFRWAEITKVQTGTQTQLGLRDPFRGPYVMLITSMGRNAPIWVNIKPYSAKGLSILAAFFMLRATNAEIDKATAAMIQRRFPSLFLANGQKGV